jgi:uncharacterized hydantoinase/oxoprolinase family protein
MPTLKDAFDGLSYATGTVTLATGTTTTTVNRMGVSKSSHIDLEPTNAAAATEWATTRPFVSSKTKGSFVITHANAATTRTISYAFRNTGG